MLFLCGFSLISFPSTSVSKQRTGDTCIIIRRRYAHLKRELQSVLKGQDDVKVVVDKRCGERRMVEQPVSTERRRADRRRPKEALVEVIIST